MMTLSAAMKAALEGVRTPKSQPEERVLLRVLGSRGLRGHGTAAKTKPKPKSAGVLTS